MAITRSLKEKVLEKIFDVELDENAAVQVLTKGKPDWEERYSGTPLVLNIKDEGVKI